jgi:hypothetical protein
LSITLLVLIDINHQDGSTAQTAQRRFHDPFKQDGESRQGLANLHSVSFPYSQTSFRQKFKGDIVTLSDADYVRLGDITMGHQCAAEGAFGQDVSLAFKCAKANLRCS